MREWKSQKKWEKERGKGGFCRERKKKEKKKSYGEYEKGKGDEESGKKKQLVTVRKNEKAEHTRWLNYV